ncbi:Zn-dependent protease with chaperone function [Nocardia transvalensis]|uniref:Zn-dependent protease with chaperone function n=1 Tax=Nocardia transvalensis TaxID=37333 RepID=A0A7W9PMB3_9NOCA|nr:Zn-dependent protease with chaperone function [Nocardia transvalensis]
MQFDDNTSPPTAHSGQRPAAPNPTDALAGWDPTTGPPGWAPQIPYSPPSPPVVQQTRGLSPYGMPARHSWEIPMLVIVIVVTVVGYLLSLLLLFAGVINDYLLLLLGAPILLWFGRGLNYATQRVNAVKMSPTQFPEGYRMVVEAAQRFGMATVPDAYVTTGNGQINAFASGHGFRRYVVVYSDLFEVGGQARDPDALSFIIGHEVGHIAAGHVSYWRQLGMFLVPFLPILGNSLIRSQEYTADNHGFCNRPVGAPGAMRVLAGGKWLNPLVGFDEMADRAAQEKGFFVWVANAMASHPVLTWRMWALRDRSRHGKLFLRPTAPPNSLPPQGFPSPGGYSPGGPGYPPVGPGQPPSSGQLTGPGQPTTGSGYPHTGPGHPSYGPGYPTGGPGSAGGPGYPPPKDSGPTDTTRYGEIPGLPPNPPQ